MVAEDVVAEEVKRHLFPVLQQSEETLGENERGQPLAYFKGISLTQKTDKSSRFVMDENYISGESFSIGYEFTQSFVRKLGLSALSVQANMNDAFRISSVKNERGIDYPFARTISFSVAATF